MPVHNNFLLDQSGSIGNPAALAQHGALIAVEIHVPQVIAEVLAADNKPIPAPSAGVALIDTGATMTCVHEAVLTGLGLNPVGAIRSGTAAGQVQQSVYPCRLVFPAQGWTLDIAGGVVGVDLAGQVASLDPPQPIVALIGRNAMTGWVFVWNGPGGFWTIAL